MKPKILLLTPVYNDWQNLKDLLHQINGIFEDKIKTFFDLVVVDDNSSERIDFNKLKFSRINKIIIIKLEKNLGSQKAIALGLKYIKNHYIDKFKTFIIDSDGQDNPLGILKMYKKNTENPDQSIVVKRNKRKDPFWFKIFYEIYNFVLTIFTFKKIRFGNFSFLMSADVNKLLTDSNLWSAFPPTITKNLVNFDYIYLDREKRLSGKSKMVFFGLIYHALKIFSVLRLRVFVLSSIYTILTYFIFFETIRLIFFLFFALLFLLNLSNLVLTFSNKDSFEKEFKKIKILEL
jgi:polyisoprenyl-phosphate glycosyltransferase